MKKILFIGIILVTYLGIGNFATKKDLIPKDAIRIRILANSDSEEDQQIKNKVKEELEPYLYMVLNDVSDSSLAEDIIKSNMPKLRELIESVFSGEYTINYGMNYFPEKEYKGITYEEGYYNSLVVSLGDGLGKNWWCILFPPLCMLEGTEMDDVEYRSLVSDIINNYF